MHQDISNVRLVLRKARQAKGWTQRDLGEKTQLGVRTIITIETGQSLPSYESLYKTIRALDISADQIFWPEKETVTLEQDQIIHEFLECSPQEQAVIMKTMRTLVRSLRDDDASRET